ncbi:hypothetical protein PR048_022543 [Dryococelus australis]|uniref:Dehydrogenase/reductase SDR family member 11 n=1 Tax=Dryococelus australis TaxID=614101 RepID=A0ABQ9H1D6_9NEOP|nr:hypothetical protein PR048_022543 [Dryococelus australis]
MAEGLKDAPGKLYAVKADLTKEGDILAAFQWVKDNLGGVDVLVNNAGMAPNNNLTDGNTSVWKQLLDLNVLALSICTREAIKSMKERGVNDGHVVHINSIAGHSVITFSGFYMYSATKHAVTALTEGLRKELVQEKSNIRVTSVSPGSVDTDALRGANLPEDMLKAMPKLLPEDIADAVVYALSAPAHVQVSPMVRQ